MCFVAEFKNNFASYKLRPYNENATTLQIDPSWTKRPIDKGTLYLDRTTLLMNI